ncbi:phage holin family protein [Acetobacterium malicum]|uniref:phage holin family protein n=1 Tax=Acetobacterium malicum TaxID=52692 RepID=UPI0003F69839|nr:phage holin family protein [Acetobacterium dehalogenans]
MSIWRYSWALLGGLIGQFLGGWDGFLLCLTAFVVIDYLTGFLAAACQQRLSSARGCRGIVKKILIFIVIGMGHLLDTLLLGGAGEPLRSAMIFFYLANEGLSILENLAALGVPIPQRLKQVLAGLGADDSSQIPKNPSNDS